MIILIIIIIIIIIKIVTIIIIIIIYEWSELVVRRCSKEKVQCWAKHADSF